MEYYQAGEVLVINCENKLLPFRNQKNFKNVMVKSYKTIQRKNPNGILMNGSDGKPLYDIGFINVFEKAVVDDNIKCIVVESFTRVCELLELYIDKTLQLTGYTKWDYYLDELMRVLLTVSGNCPKPIIWTALPEITIDSDGVRMETTAVSGKLKGKIESYFEIVLCNSIDDKAKELSDRYLFTIRSNGKNSAKVPAELYNEKVRSIPNDINAVLNEIRKMYGVKITDEFHYPKILILGRSGMGKSSSLRNLVKGEDDATTETK